MSLELIPGQILQVEVVLSPDEFDAHIVALGAIATTLAGVRKNVIPVVTSPVYKQNLCEDGLDGTAQAFEQQIERVSSKRLTRLMDAARDEYEDDLGLGTDVNPAHDRIAEPISDWVLTIATRRSFVNSLGSLDTDGIQQRVERLRATGGWMICILDASDGLLVTGKKTAKMVDLLLEGQSGDLLNTQINPLPGDSPDIAVFEKPQSLEKFLIDKEIVRDKSALSAGADRAPESTHSVYDMAELYNIFMSVDPPQNSSLNDFEQWIQMTGTIRSHFEDYLLPICQGMKEAANAPNLAAQEAAVKEIRASLTDALLNHRLDPYIVKECACVINTHVLKSK